MTIVLSALITAVVLQSPAPAKVAWTIVSVAVQRYTMADRADQVDPIVRDGTMGLRILMTARYDGSGEGLPPELTVVPLPTGKPLQVPGNIGMSGMADIDAMTLFMDGLNQSKKPRQIKPGRTFGAASPIMFYAVDVPLDVDMVRVTFGDASPRDIKVTPTPTKP